MATGPYNETVMEHFMNPRNVGEIEGADGVGEVGNPACGDMMRLYLKLEDGKVFGTPEVVRRLFARQEARPSTAESR